MASFVECENISCTNHPQQQTFPADKALWIDDTHTVCCEACREQFLKDHPHIADTLAYEPEVLPASVIRQRIPPQEQGLLISLRALLARLVERLVS